VPGTRLPRWASISAIGISLAFAWVNYLTTGRWADQPGALHGWRGPCYVAALTAATLLLVHAHREVGRPVSLGRGSRALALAGFGVLLASFLCRLPPWTWHQLLFKDDWTELFVQATNGVALLKRGVVVGWNWHFLGGYPTSTDIAQNFSLPAFLPMAIFGDRIGYHVYHLVIFLAVPVIAWWDLRHEDREAGWLTAGWPRCSPPDTSARSDRVATPTRSPAWSARRWRSPAAARRISGGAGAPRCC
jgi:hypothetical protein